MGNNVLPLHGASEIPHPPLVFYTAVWTMCSETFTTPRYNTLQVRDKDVCFSLPPTPRRALPCPGTRPNVAFA